MSFNSKLIAILKTDHRFIDEDGELVLAAVQDHAWRLDHSFIKLLLDDIDIKTKFFDEIEGHWVFNLNAFIEYASQKNFLDNSYTRFRNRIGLTIGGKYLVERGEVALVWPYKDCFLEGGQTKEEEKRHEIFFNEILADDEITRLLAPKVLTSFSRFTANGKQTVKEIRRDANGGLNENLVLKGNNLISLHSLANQFQSRVKLIYIDPPFNIGSDSFKYNDNFSHSSWLTFMKKRLEIAKECLRPDGTIFIHIDDTELGYLIALADEILGRNNRVNVLTFKQGSATGHKSINPGCVTTTNFILIYARNREQWEPNQLFTRRERNKRYNKYITNRGSSHDQWEFTTLARAFAESQSIPSKDAKKQIPDYESKLMDFILANGDSVIRLAVPDYDSVGAEVKRAIDRSKREPRVVIHLPRTGYPDMYFLQGERILFYSDIFKEIDGEMITGEPLTSLWDDVPSHNLHNEGGVTLRNGKKPEGLLRRILEMCTETGDIVMDFLSGSGTTAAVAHKMGLKYIAIEKLEYGGNDTTIRLCNVIEGDSSGISGAVGWKGGGDFIYCELMKYNEAYIERIMAAKTSKELITIWKEMAEQSFLNWYVNPEVPEDAVNDFEAIGNQEGGLKKQKHLLAELLDKNQLYVNLTEIEDTRFKVSEEDKALNKAFYGEA